MLRLVPFLMWVGIAQRRRDFLLRLEDTRRCGEQKSPHVVIDVVIYSLGGW
jgi:hypothetical protein